jgi:hypothetical protein
VRGTKNEYLKDTLMDGELVLDIDQHKVSASFLILLQNLVLINYLYIENLAIPHI